MGFGFNRMNQVVVQQTTQGFCKYLQEQAGPKLATQGVAIGMPTGCLMSTIIAFRNKSDLVVCPKTDVEGILQDMMVVTIARSLLTWPQQCL
jgi:hypothetical protein